MDLNSLKKDIIGIVAEKLEIERDSISLESTFEELGADRFYKLSIVDGVEERYRIIIPNRNFEEFKTVGDIVDYFKK